MLQFFCQCSCSHVQHLHLIKQHKRGSHYKSAINNCQVIKETTHTYIHKNSWKFVFFFFLKNPQITHFLHVSGYFPHLVFLWEENTWSHHLWLKCSIDLVSWGIRFKTARDCYRKDFIHVSLQVLSPNVICESPFSQPLKVFFAWIITTSTEYEVITTCLIFICLMYISSGSYTHYYWVRIFYIRVQYLYKKHLNSLGSQQILQ